MQTLIVKFLSCAFAVGCGMPVGYEGPMIHLGSLVAAGMSQFKSATFECSLPCFSRFRNSEDRRNFISAGAAAGTRTAPMPASTMGASKYDVRMKAPQKNYTGMD